MDMPPKKNKAKARKGTGSAKSVVNALKAVAKKVKARTRVRKETSSDGGKLGSFGHIKPFIRTKHLDEGMIVEIYDVIAKLNVSEDFMLVFNELLNPGNGALFKKVGAIAEMFEKYRFKLLELRYEPLATELVSGDVGMVILTDVDANPPNDEVAINNYDSGVIGPVSRTSSCRAKMSNEDIFRVVETSTSAEKSFYSGRVCLYTSNSQATGNPPIAGMVGIHCIIEFKHARGQRPGMINVYNTEDQKVTGGGDTAVDWGESEEQRGWFDWAADKTAQVLGYVTGTTQTNSFSAEKSWWTWAVDLALSAVVASDEKSDDGKWVVCGERKVAYANQHARYIWRNPKYHPHLKRCAERNAAAFWLDRGVRKPIWDEKGQFLGPNAAGDYNVYLTCQNSDGTGENVIVVARTGGGTGAVAEELDNDLFAIPHVGCRLVTFVTPTGTESRNVLSGSSHTLTKFSDASDLVQD